MFRLRFRLLLHLLLLLEKLVEILLEFVMVEFLLLKNIVDGGFIRYLLAFEGPRIVKLPSTFDEEDLG